MHILDVAENGIIAGADLIRIKIKEDLKRDQLEIVIEDNGRGMTPEFVATVLDPFVTTRTTRKVGLGLSLFQQSAQEAQGDMEIESAPGKGSKIKVWMKRSHIDRKPMGDIAETIVTLIQGSPDIDFVFDHVVNHDKENNEETRSYHLDTRDLKKDLEEVPLNHPEVVGLINEDINKGLRELL